MSATRVFITGYGSVSSIAPGTSLLQALAAAPAAPAAPRRPVPDDTFAPYLDDKLTRRMDRFTLLAYIAVRKALAHAGVDPAALSPERFGIIMNTGYGPLDSTRKYIIKLIRDGARKVPAAVFPNTVHNAFTGLITMAIRAHGSNSTVSGQNPVCYGFDMIRSGRDDLMLVGGCDEMLASITGAFAAAAGASDVPFALGEGAAVLVLESEAALRRRGATPLAELLEYGMSNGLAGPEGMAFPADRMALTRAMRQALERAGMVAGQVGLVSAASNGLAHVAAAERAALEDVFGTPDAAPVANAKTVLGETLGAAACFSVVLALEAMAAGPLGIALVNAVEMGGTVTTLALKNAAGPHRENGDAA